VAGQDTKAFATRAAIAQALGGFLPARGQRIGLLGGSFNPAHEGHLQISREATKRLGLDGLWWLVTPQSPLKPDPAGSSARRLAQAGQLTVQDPIRVASLEQLLGTRYSVDTLAELKRRFPGVRFVWLMGADNLADLHRWHAWAEIFSLVPIAVFDRPTYSLRAGLSKAARRFRTRRLPEGSAKSLAEKDPPAWVFLHCRLNPRSSTALRGET
jgi:nicotinate-nucleotide adenylyltransferase